MRNEECIAQIEARLAEIDAEIAGLIAEREVVLFSDEEYASYVEHYQAHYDDEPLNIREYYGLDEELSTLNDEIMAADDEHFDEVWRKHENRLRYLERKLAA